MIPHRRWSIGGRLFASTVVNDIGRQTLNALTPYLRDEYEWSNERIDIVDAHR